jgi:hypothetical protein
MSLRTLTESQNSEISVKILRALSKGLSFRNEVNLWLQPYLGLINLLE